MTYLMNVLRMIKVLFKCFFTPSFVFSFMGSAFLFVMGTSSEINQYLRKSDKPQRDPLYYAGLNRLSLGGAFYYSPTCKIMVSYFDSGDKFPMKHFRMSSRDNRFAIGVGKNDKDFICSDNQIYFLKPSEKGIEVEQFPYCISLFLEKFLENNWEQSGKPEHKVEVLNYTFHL